MDFTDTKAQVERQGTEGITKLRGTVMRAAMYTAVVGGLIGFSWWLALTLGDEKRSASSQHGPGTSTPTVETQVPLTSWPRNRWLRATLRPKGEPLVLPIWRHLRPVVIGSNFYIECGTAGGTKVRLSPNSSGPCPDGPYETVVSTSIENNELTYAFEQNKY